MESEDANTHEQARRIVKGLLAGDVDFPLIIDRRVFNEVYKLLRQEQHNPRVSILVIADIVQCQFSSISSCVFTLQTRDRRLNEDDFGLIENREFKRVARVRGPLIAQIAKDVMLLKWLVVVITIISVAVFIMTSPQDMHDYFVIVVQALALIFTLYTLYRTSSINTRSLSMKQFRIGFLDELFQSDRIVAATAVISIALCLLGILLTAPSIAAWDAHHVLWKASIALEGIKTTSIAVGTLLNLTLFSFFRSLVFYFPDRDFGVAFQEGADQWFRECYTRAKMESDPQRGSDG